MGAILCLVAVVASAAFASGVSALINVCFGLAGCLHGSREILVVACATGLAAAISLVVALLYLHFSHKEVLKQTSPDPFEDKKSPRKQSKLMLIETTDGRT